MNICLVTNEIVSSPENGGNGAATVQLSALLAANHHNVTLLCVGQRLVAPVDKLLHFSSVEGVNVVWYRGDYDSISPEWMKQPTQIFEQLRFSNFDVILFEDRLALGHSCMVAKRCGLAFRNTTLAVITHGSTPWVTEANRVFPGTKFELATAHMEQSAIELSDALVSPSAYLVEWMRHAAWKLPERTSVIPNFRDALQLRGVEPPTLRTLRTISNPAHLIFFGPLDKHKGIDIFLAALSSEDLAALPFKLTFLGQPGSTSVDTIRKHIAARRPDLLAQLEFKIDLASEEAQAYLQSSECISVIPSLNESSPNVIYELCKLGAPFIAANSGGIPELIHPDDRERCLFEPTAKALATKLREILTSSVWHTPRPAYTTDQIASAWLTWSDSFRSPASTLVAAVAAPRSPEITVIITHHERPHLVALALEALALQTDPHFEVLFIDDGSKTESSLEFLDQLEQGFEGLELRVLRQPNKYLGAARNEALRHARTPYVIFLDDDNIPFPTMVEVFLQAARSSNADIITCQMQLLDDPQKKPELCDLEFGPRWAFSGGPVALSTMMNCYGDATGIYKRELFEQVGNFHELQGVGHEDWEMYVRSAALGKTILSLPLPLFWYRMSADSMIRTTNHYRNMQAISSAFKKRVPADLAPLFDYVIGRDARS